MPKAVKRFVKKHCVKKNELKRVSVFGEDLNLISKTGDSVSREFTQLILPGFDDTNRIGREVLLQGIKIKYILNAKTGAGPLLVRWAVLQHVGFNVAADAQLLYRTDRDWET